jgi:hypothetical protein
MPRVLLTCLLAICACTNAHSAIQPAPTVCSPTPPVGARPISDDQVAALAGSFHLVQVNTSFGPTSGHQLVWRGRLRLTLVDSAARAASRERRFGHSPRPDLQLAGTLLWRDSTSWTEPAEVDESRLYVGCGDCLDGSPEVFEMTHVNPEGFWGRWEDYQTGIVRAADERTGEWLPNPAGYFCAWREAEGRAPPDV